MRYSVDIETVLCELMEDDGRSASAHMVPATLGNTLPHVHIVRTGGLTSDLVIEINSVDFDVYAGDAADAMAAACELTEWVRDLPGRSSATIYSAEITTLPYENPDPRHPTLGRATLKAQIFTRIKEGL